MFEPSRFALFVAASWVLIIAPGPDTLYVITRGVAHGRRAGMLSAVGVIGGTLVHTTAAALGLAFILQTSATAFLIVKYAGAFYLLYLGLKSLRDRSNLYSDLSHVGTSLRALFWQGVLSNVLNPKVAVFFVAFLPQFVNKESGNVALQMAVLGLTFALFGLSYLITVGYFAGSIGTRLIRQPRFANALRWVTGGTLIGLGMRLALPERR